MDIKNRVIKTELIPWQKLKPLQPAGFKELTKNNFEKLKASLINNNFAMPFTVWQSKDIIYIIDGTHRHKVLEALEKEGYTVPKMLPAVFIDCEDKKEASKLVLIYSSIYAKVTDDGLFEFLNLEGFNLDGIKNEIDIPGLNLDIDIFDGDINDFFQDSNIKTKDKEVICPFCGKNINEKKI